MNQTARTNLQYICNALRCMDCSLVTISYDGSGDSGQIENTNYYKSTKESPSDIIADADDCIDGVDYYDDNGDNALKNNKGAEVFHVIEALDTTKLTSRIPTYWDGKPELEKVGTLEEAIEAFVYANIPTPGWENNAGGQGICLINVHGGTATFKHADRIEDVNTCETTISTANEGEGD